MPTCFKKEKICKALIPDQTLLIFSIIIVVLRKEGFIHQIILTIFQQTLKQLHRFSFPVNFLLTITAYPYSWASFTFYYCTTWTLYSTLIFLLLLLSIPLHLFFLALAQQSNTSCLYWFLQSGRDRSNKRWEWREWLLWSEGSH
jgi:hypothetical protein